jgi:hypothetical protein
MEQNPAWEADRFAASQEIPRILWSPKLFCLIHKFTRSEIATHHATRQNMPTHNILSTALQLSISQKALVTLPEDGNIMPKHVEATIHNY